MTKSSPSPSPPTSSSPGDAGPGATTEPPERSLGAARALLLDLCGELCPFTFVRTKLTLEELPMGALLRVIVDHEPATRNIPRSATEWGQEVIAVTSLSPHTWAIDLRKRVR
jgi:tRNA 2-thiouridine synthesizing protein A